MLRRVITWALWSPTRLATAAAGAFVALLLLAAFFAPHGGGSGADGAAAALSASPSPAGTATAAPAPRPSDDAGRLLDEIRQDAAQVPVDDLAEGVAPRSTPLPTTGAGGPASGQDQATSGTGHGTGHGTVEGAVTNVPVPAAAKGRSEAEPLFRRFVRAWLKGRDATTVRAWVEDDLCADDACTPDYERAARTTALGLIPDTTLDSLKVDGVGDATATAVATLKDDTRLRVSAEWDGTGWQVSGLEPA